MCISTPYTAAPLRSYIYDFKSSQHSLSRRSLPELLIEIHSITKVSPQPGRILLKLCSELMLCQRLTLRSLSGYRLSDRGELFKRTWVSARGSVSVIIFLIRYRDLKVGIVLPKAVKAFMDPFYHPEYLADEYTQGSGETGHQIWIPQCTSVAPNLDKVSH